MRKWKTTADLVGLPGWTVDPTPTDPDLRPGADWSGHGVQIAIVHDAEEETWSVWIGGAGPTVFDGDQDGAVAYAQGAVAVLNAAVAHALAAAAPPPPPTTIAELAARPGWRLDDGDAMHDDANILATLSRVDLGSGDAISCLDEQEAAELAFAIAPIEAAAQIRYAAARAGEG